MLKGLFAKHGFSSDLRQLDSQDEQGENGKIVDEFNLAGAVTTDQLTEEILAEDGRNICNLEWEQKKSSTYIYN